MVSMLGFLVHTVWVLTVAGVTCAASYWLIRRFLGTAAEAPDVAQPQLNNLPAARED